MHYLASAALACSHFRIRIWRQQTCRGGCIPYEKICFTKRLETCGCLKNYLLSTKLVEMERVKKVGLGIHTTNTTTLQDCNMKMENSVRFQRRFIEQTEAIRIEQSRLKSSRSMNQDVRELGKFLIYSPTLQVHHRFHHETNKHVSRHRAYLLLSFRKCSSSLFWSWCTCLGKVHW